MAKKVLVKSKKKNSKALTAGGDIVELILRDHRELKDLYHVMKDDDASYAQRKAAFKKFAPLLVAHAKAEEQTWYQNMKTEEDMNVEALEGDTEHELADGLCKQTKKTKDKDTFLARCKVLAELLDHHIKEEEKEMLPAYKHQSSIKQRTKLGTKYEKLHAKYLKR